MCAFNFREVNGLYLAGRQLSRKGLQFVQSSFALNVNVHRFVITSADIALKHDHIGLP